MKLTLDIGNTQIKFGVFNKEDIVYSSYFNDFENIENKFKKIKQFNPEICIISSVVPSLTLKYENQIKDFFNIDTFIINAENCKIKLDVTKPETVGADRICNVAAVKNIYNNPSIIVDFGTATTYDVVNRRGAFIGGAIAPGIKTSAEYLISKAALLKDTDLKFPKNIIGKNTKENIQAGIMFGAVDQVEGMITRLNTETKLNNQIILTGGFSKLLSPKLKIPHTLDIDLTLKGMIFIYESNN